MVISRCCKEYVYIEFVSEESVSYYVCGHCDRTCATITSDCHAMECIHDTGSAYKTQEFTDQA
jgi:hypothetical protein